MSWLKQLQAYDEVMIDPAFELPIQLHRVCRTTKTHIIVGMWRFRRKDGLRIGDSARNQARLLEPTDELRARVDRIDASRFIIAQSKLLERVPLEYLAPVVKALKAVA